MSHPPESPRPRQPTASSALLSAALGGLLCFAPACRTGGDPSPPDTGVPTDVSAATDLGPGTDAQTPVDAVVADAQGSDGAPADAAVADAGSPDVVDAGALPDVQPDVVAVDALTDAAIADGPFVCDVVADRVISASDAAPGMTLEAFRATCDSLGGFIEIHPHCGGMNSCQGLSYDEGLGILTEHNCAALNTCGGYSCVVP